MGSFQRQKLVEPHIMDPLHSTAGPSNFQPLNCGVAAMSYELQDQPIIVVISIDYDGRVDVVVSRNGNATHVLRNESPANAT